MAYDGLVNHSIVKELQNIILNGKVDKIFEPNFDEIILGIYSNGCKYALDLVVSSNFYRANLTTNIKVNPAQAPNFCMALRKYLLGTHITDIYTKGLERIIFIEFEGYNKVKDFSTKKLIVELMGKHSNIILVNNQDIIIDALKHFSITSGATRNIFAGAKYEFPKSNKLDFFEVSDKDEFYRIIINNSLKYNSNSLCDVICKVFTGLSTTSISGIENELSISDTIEKDNCYKLFDYLVSLINYNNQVICYSFENNYALKCSTKENTLQTNFFLDDYYSSKESNAIFNTYKNNLLRLILNRISKLNLKLGTINCRLNECKDAEKYKLYGELITSNLYRITDYNVESLTLENYYDSNNPITIVLDKSVSPLVNAKRFFKKYKKLKNAKKFVDEQKLSLVGEIDYLESIVYEINSAKDIMDIDSIYNEIQEYKVKINSKNSSNKIVKNSNSKQKNLNRQSSSRKGLNHKISRQNILNKENLGEPLKFEIDGFTVLVGRNNRQNDYLSTKLANKDDIWFHVKDFHGSHLILRTENRTPSEDILYKCAKLAKEHSKANASSNVLVDYTFVKYVKKPSGSKPGMVIYTHEHSIMVH